MGCPVSTNSLNPSAVPSGHGTLYMSESPTLICCVLGAGTTSTTCACLDNWHGSIWPTPAPIFGCGTVPLVYLCYIFNTCTSIPAIGVMDPCPYGVPNMHNDGIHNSDHTSCVRYLPTAQISFWYIIYTSHHRGYYELI